MGQTLTHGIYLPDEGERNCYDGLASNWAILDGAVGTVANHTTALSGKAPLVHTHTKSDITDFPAYGNAAGTICEGNDSRLSDARTPVSHTHVTADVTDLLNSAHTWSAENTYTYAITLKQTNLEKGELPTSNQTRRYRFTDKNNADLGWLQHRVGISGDSYLECLVINKFSNGQLSTQGNEVINSIVLGLHGDGSRYLTVMGDVSPDIPNRVCNLGTTNNKWKTLNGVNPGALSLPDYNNYLDVTSSIPVASLDGSTQININDYLPNKTGWLSIVIDDTAGNSIIATQGRSGGSTVYNNSRTFHTGAQSNGFISVFFPILADMNKFVSIKASSLVQMRFYYCLGNV